MDRKNERLLVLILFLISLAASVGGFHSRATAVVALALAVILGALWIRPTRTAKVEGVANLQAAAAGVSMVGAVATFHIKAPFEVLFNPERGLSALWGKYRGCWITSLHPRATPVIPEGHYFCKIESGGHAWWAERTVTEGQIPTRAFPLDFDGAPASPPEQGSYTVTWFLEEPTMKRKMAEGTFGVGAT